MNNEEQKPKKKRYIGITFLSILPLITSLFTIYSIYLIDGIENKLRYIAMGGIFLLNIIIAIIIKKTAKKSKAKLIFSIILVMLFMFIEIFIGYFIFKTYSSLDNMNKDTITYTTAIVVKNDSNIEQITDLDKKKIGIVIDETSIDGYHIGVEIIENEKLEDNNEIKEYATPSSLVKDLYDKKIDAIIISKNYPSMFKTINEYKNIENETKIIYEKSKKLTKEQIAKYTGDEIINFNSSDKIDKPFTLLVMGIDSTAETLNKNATGNGDSLMLITFNPKTLNATILSIPRDSYVPIACFAGEKENKITHAAWNGESCMIKTIQNFTGINIDYYVKVNFQGVIKIVNALDGITVDVPVEFCESNSKRSTKQENLICLKKGKQKLNGEQALALARHRKTLLTGDLQRGVNQQLVVQGILNKVKNIRSVNQLLTLLDTISNSMDTNFTTKQILSFYDIAKKLMKSSNASSNLITMQQLYLSGASQMIYDEGMGLVLYNYILNQDGLNEVISAMKQNLELETPKMITSMTFDIKKTYKSKTIGADVTTATKTYTLLPNFVGESESYAVNWLSNNGVSYSVVTKEVTSGNNGQVLSQSMPSGKRLDLITGGVTLTVTKVVANQNNNTTPEENSNENDNEEEVTDKNENNNGENQQDANQNNENKEEPID